MAVTVLALLGLLANGRAISSGWPSAPSALDDAGGELMGKLAASLGCAAAALFLFLAVARRRTTEEARTAALLLVFGTTVWAAAQSLTPTPFSTALVAVAVWMLVRAEDEPAAGPRAGLPLALAVALHPVDLALALTVALFAIARRPRQAGLLALWSAPGVVLALGRMMAAPPPGLAFGETWAPRLAALVVSPAMGLFVFAPVVIAALVGLAGSLRGEDAPLALSFGTAVLAHGLFLAGQPLGAGTWGRADWTDAMPLCLLFLPQGLDRLRSVGTLLAILSVAVQALGAFTYDGRWDRLHAGTPERRAAALWDLSGSPLPLAIRERTLILALPQVHEGRVTSAEHRIVFGAPQGARLTARGSRLVVEGADPTFGQAHLLGGAEAQGDRIRLESAGDAIFLRVRPESRGRRLEVRVVGRGQGTLALEEASFWSPTPRVHERTVSGDFRWTVPYHYAESGGGDLRVRLRSGGNVLVTSIRLVPPSEPDKVIRLQGEPDP
jgi:hypothetical protein